MMTSLKWFLAGLAVLASPTMAAPANEISVGVSTLSYDSYIRPSTQFLVFEAAYHRALGAEGFWHGIRVGGGLRTATPFNATWVPLEAFGQIELTGRLGPWEPTVGPEVGVSGFGRLVGSDLGMKFDIYATEQRWVSPVYLALGAAPLRFHFGNFTISAVELHLGTGVPHPGTSIRIHLGFLNVGMQL